VKDGVDGKVITLFFLNPIYSFN